MVVLVGKRPGHLPLNGSAPWAAGMGSPAGIPYAVGVKCSPATIGTRVTKNPFPGPLPRLSGEDAVEASRSGPPVPATGFSIRPCDGSAEKKDPSPVDKGGGPLRLRNGGGLAAPAAFPFRNICLRQMVSFGGRR